MYSLLILNAWRNNIQMQRPGNGRTTWSDRILKTGLRRSAVTAQKHPENALTHGQVQVRLSFPAG